MVFKAVAILFSLLQCGRLIWPANSALLESQTRLIDQHSHLRLDCSTLEPPTWRPFCRNDKRLTSAVIDATNEALRLCKSAFRKDRWNCSVDAPLQIAERSSTSLISKGYRETAYLQALTAAAVTINIARACRDGRLGYRCKCARDNNDIRTRIVVDEQSNIVLGCSHDLRFGRSIAREYLSSQWFSSEFKWIRRHNIFAGLETVFLKKEKQCRKLHNLRYAKFCWIEAPDLTKIAKILYRAYRRNQAPLRFSPACLAPDAAHNSLPCDPRRRPDTKSLIHVERTLNFCEVVPELKITGTEGRRCSLQKNDSYPFCRRFCCNGSWVQKATLSRSCECDIVWGVLNCENCTSAIHNAYVCT